MGRRVRRSVRISKKEMRRRALWIAEQIAGESEGRYELIQMLIPLGLAAVGDQLQLEVERLTGKRYERDEETLRRWRSNSGSVYLGGQKVGIEVPRVRDVRQKAAYEQPTYEKAKAKLMLIRKELSLINQSAVASLDEGLEETLTLHRLRVIKELGRSFKTTNCIEALNRQIEMRTGRVSYWKNSEQRQRWVAMALLEIAPSLNKVAGHASLKLLREKMKVSGPLLIKEAA